MHTTRAALLLSLLSTTACIAGGGFTAGTGGRGTAGPGTASSGGDGVTEGAYGGDSGAMAGNAGSAPAAGPAEPRWDDFAFAVRERQGTYYGPWVMTKFTTFKVSPTCYAKLGDKDSWSLNTTSYYISDVLELAKKWTGDDWRAIEEQNNDHAKNRELVEPMMDAFKSRFHLTIAVEGDDCETSSSALWVRYWYDIGEAIKDYPSLGGKMLITLNVTPSARELTTEVDETGTVFTITAPRDIEAKDWNEKLSKVFRKNAAKL